MPDPKIRQLLFIGLIVAALATGLALMVGGGEPIPVQAQGEVPFANPITGTFALAPGQRLQPAETTAVPFGGRVGAAAVSGQDLLVDKGCVTNPGSAYIDVPPSAFQAAESSPADGYRFWPEGGYLYNTTALTMHLIAPAYLPDGVTITNIALVYYDAGLSTDIELFLLRKRHNDPGLPAAKIFGFYSSQDNANSPLCASPPSTKTVTAINDNYFVVARLPANLSSDLAANQRLIGLRIYYDPPDSAAVLQKAVAPIAAFRANGDDAQYTVLDYQTNGYIRSSGTATPCLMAPIYPPAGATLLEFRISIRDVITTANQNIAVQLQRVRLDNGVINPIAQIATTDSSPILEAVEGFDAIAAGTGLELVSDEYDYYITFCLPPNPGDTTDLLFFGSRVFYTLP